MLFVSPTGNIISSDLRRTLGVIHPSALVCPSSQAHIHSIRVYQGTVCFVDSNLVQSSPLYSNNAHIDCCLHVLPQVVARVPIKGDTSGKEPAASCCAPATS